MSFTPAPVTLEGRVVRLEPLAPRHVEPLLAVALDPTLWRWTSAHVASADDWRRYAAQAMDDAARGLAVPFATVERASGRPIGSTRFGTLAPEHGRVEIGWTFVGKAWQRTAVNTEAKRLMLAHAFEVWGCRRVELRTDALNAASRAAILRLGAVEEGTLRQQHVTETGRVRDTVYFSILAEEWPAVRDRLDAWLVYGETGHGETGAMPRR